MGWGSFRFLTGISVPVRPPLKADPFSSRTSPLSLLISLTLVCLTLSGGRLAWGMFLMIGMEVARVGLMLGGPAATFVAAVP